MRKTSLAFLSERNGEKTQVWTLFRQGGDAVQRTKVRQGVDSFEWSPDGSRMVLVIKDPKPEDLEEKSDKDKKTPTPWVIDRLQFKQDYVGYLDRRRTGQRASFSTGGVHSRGGETRSDHPRQPRALVRSSFRRDREHTLQK